jgi:3-oxoacyl-[acyl-carrier-protein] synthase II
MAGRVVITGVGLVSPIGLTLAEFGERLYAGQWGVRPVTHFDRERLVCRRAGEVDNAAFDAHWKAPDHETKRLGRFVQFALSCARDAAIDAFGHTDILEALGRRGAVYSGLGMGGLGEVERGVVVQETRGARWTSPYLIPSFIPSMPASAICRQFGLRCAPYTFAGSCAGGAQAIGEAAAAIARGDIDWALAGGTEAVITPLGFSGFQAMQAFTLADEGTPRPFDVDRAGMIVGEGAAFFVLEAAERARARGARLHGEIRGYATEFGSDSLTLQSVDAAASCLRAALDHAHLTPRDIDCVIARGNGAVGGDRVELQALRSVFGEVSPGPSYASIEGHMGHTFGASAALGAVAALLAIAQQRVPPTCHFTRGEDEFASLDIRGTAHSRTIRTCMVDAYGFGGINAALVLTAPDL